MLKVRYDVGIEGATVSQVQRNPSFSVSRAIYAYEPSLWALRISIPWHLVEERLGVLDIGKDAPSRRGVYGEAVKGGRGARKAQARAGAARPPLVPAYPGVPESSGEGQEIGTQ